MQEMISECLLCLRDVNSVSIWQIPRTYQTWDATEAFSANNCKAFYPTKSTKHTQTDEDITLDSPWPRDWCRPGSLHSWEASVEQGGQENQEETGKWEGTQPWRTGEIEVLNPSCRSEKRMTPMSSQDRTLQVIGEIEHACRLIKIYVCSLERLMGLDDEWPLGPILGVWRQSFKPGGLNLFFT